MAKGEVYCHLRLLFKELSTEEANKLKDHLVKETSTRSEHMNGHVFHFYGFTEIVIS